jgi:hypothetical protein
MTISQQALNISELILVIIQPTRHKLRNESRILRLLHCKGHKKEQQALELPVYQDARLLTLRDKTWSCPPLHIHECWSQLREYFKVQFYY